MTNLPSWSHVPARSHNRESKGYLMPVVVVESPAKAKTIEKFLGKDFKVESSFGHISDLPSKVLGVDVEDTFDPTMKFLMIKKRLLKS